MRHALVVDDRTENLWLLRALLEAYSFTVDEARNGVEALEKARQVKPALVISDLMMPVMDGYTLLREWRRDPTLCEVPFIVYTATYTQPKDEKLALDLGADAFIVKPAEPEIFMRRVHDVLDSAGQTHVASRVADATEEETLKLYSEVLVGKLEQRTEQLEQRVAELAASEEHIIRLNRLYAALSETNQAIVHCSDREELFRAVCRIAVERGGLKLAWIGMIDSDTNEIVPIAWNGDWESWLARFRPFSLAGPPRVPVEFALGEDRIYQSNDLDADDALSPIAGALREAGLRAVISLPLRIGGRAVGAISLYASEVNFFDDRLRDLVIEMANDVSFALENFEKEERLLASLEAVRLNSRAIEASANGVMITSPADGRLRITYVNPAFTRITGYSEVEALGRSPDFLMGDDTEQFGVAEVDAAIREHREGQAVLRNYRKDGGLFWSELSIAPVRDAAGHTTHYVGIINDITERKQYEEQLERQNNQDALTGLASRNLLRDRTEQAIAFAARHGRSVALLFLDVDDFKRINDSLGHGPGDAILRDLAARISSCVRDRDTLARLGGDEFVILSDLEDLQDVPTMCTGILRAIDRPMPVGSREINVTASIGVAVFPEDGGDYDTLLRNADTAMYSAKQAGRNTFRFYTAGMNEEALRRLELESKLRGALARDELLLHYQPIVSLDGKPTANIEALLRWRTGSGPLILPEAFIKLAEQTGLIVAIGEWVMKTACRQARQWLDAGFELRVGVNLSARQFHDRNLVEITRRCLEESGLPPRLLRLEITESAIMENAGEAAGVLAELKSLGVCISVDDFGTGYSSLAYLRRFPIDQLKIDRSFVHDLHHPDSAAIVLGIIGLARSLRLEAVAEGVETTSQRDFLVGAGCDLMQGFLFSHPLPPDDLHRLVTEELRAHRDGGHGARSADVPPA
ncbi:MAG: EAL domain-containing protein [Thermoanaerobaculia bacterium]